MKCSTVSVLLAATASTAAQQVPLLGYSSQSEGLILPETHEWISSLLHRRNSSGLSVAVVRKDDHLPTGWEIDFGSYGIATADGQHVTPDTMFAIASNSKLFLSLSVGLIMANESLGKKLDWNSKATEVFKGTNLWGLMDEDLERGINVQDMLSHRTGLPRHDLSGQSREGGIAEMVCI